MPYLFSKDWFSLGICLLLTCAYSGKVLSQVQTEIKEKEILDLKADYTQSISFSAKSREFFVTRSNTELEQWNVDQKNLLHTYSSPDGIWDNVEISPDGEILVATTYPPNFRKAKLFIIDAKMHKTMYESFIEDGRGKFGEICFNRTGEFIWISTTGKGPDSFVYGRDGSKHTEFIEKDFIPESKNRLWDVGARKGGVPPAGLFYKDNNDVTHKLIENPGYHEYALTRKGEYIGASDQEGHVRIWRTSDLQEIFNKKIGAYPVPLVYDDRDNQFIVMATIRRRTRLFAIKLP